MDDYSRNWRPEDQCLPSTQHVMCDCTTPGCSKALRGLRLQVEVTGPVSYTHLTLPTKA